MASHQIMERDAFHPFGPSLTITIPTEQPFTSLRGATDMTPVQISPLPAAPSVTKRVRFSEDAPEVIPSGILRRVRFSDEDPEIIPSPAHVSAWGNSEDDEEDADQMFGGHATEMERFIEMQREIEAENLAREALAMVAEETRRREWAEHQPFHVSGEYEVTRAMEESRNEGRMFVREWREANRLRPLTRRRGEEGG